MSNIENQAWYEDTDGLLAWLDLGSFVTGLVYGEQLAADTILDLERRGGRVDEYYVQLEAIGNPDTVNFLEQNSTDSLIAINGFLLGCERAATKLLNERRV